MKLDLFGNIIDEPKEEVVKVSKPSPFDFVNNIANKKYPTDLRGYNPYITNAAFSQRKDLVLYANEMNMNFNLPERAQFDFYYNALPKKNLFAKWAKMDKRETTDMVMEYFGVSYKVAKQYERVLDDTAMKKIQEWYQKRLGGKSNKN